MDARVLAQLERLAAAGIQLLPVPELEHHFVLERAGCAVLVQCRGGGFGGIGSPGALTGRGFEALVERPAGPRFVSKGLERPPLEGEAEAARALLRDVQLALNPNPGIEVPRSGC